MNESHLLGRRAEDIAAEYLLSLGWKILERNAKNRYGELDITALDGRELVIVEVRCRTIGEVQSALDSIGSMKLRTLLRSSMFYVDGLGWEGFWRIDAIGITVKGKHLSDGWELEHVKDITVGMEMKL